MFNFGKKYVNFVPVIVAVFILLGAVGISSKVYASPSTNIGVVDFQFLVSQHPDVVLAQQTMKTEGEQAQKAYNDKTATMTNEQEKQAYFSQLQQQLDEKDQALVAKIQDKVMAVVKKVADAKGLTIVVDKGTAIYGGQDITDEVGKKINGK